MNYQDKLERSPLNDRSAVTLRAIAAARFERAAAVPFRERLERIRRAWRRLTVWTLICVGIALTYCLLATPKFLVTTDVVLEPRQPVSSTDPAAQTTAPTLDSALADSQVQVLMSERNLSYVFDSQHLEKDPEFAQTGVDPIGWLLGRLPFVAPPPSSPQEKAKRARQMAYENFASQVSVKRLAQSYAFELAFYADNPDKAMRIGNAITAAYIRDKLIYNIAAAEAQRGGDFLQNRVADTKAEQDAAANAVKTGVIPDYVFGHADARIISSAIEPLKKTYPRTTLIVGLALAFALLSGVVGVVVSDEIDRRIRSARRLQALTGLTALACIPVVKEGRRRPAALLKWALSAPNGRLAAEVRNLRVAALQLAQSVSFPSVGVLSYRRGEGRSTVAANLAAVLAEIGTQVTLVDGDIFNPALTRAFAPAAERGLAEAVDSSVDRDPRSLLVNVAPCLSILPARALASEFDANRFVGFTATTAACAALAQSSFVIVDLPPVSESPDGAATARGLTAVFLIVDAEAVTVDEFLGLLDRLAENDVRVLGVTLNKAEPS